MFGLGRLHNAFRQFISSVSPTDDLIDKEIKETCQSIFTNNILSKDHKSFIYQPIILEPLSDTYFTYTIIRNRNIFRKTVYTVICKDTKDKIMYIIENKKFYQNYKSYSIYLNYKPRQYVGYLPKDIETLIYSFDGEKFNKKEKNGLYIGKIVTDKNLFVLDTNHSDLLENYSYKNNNMRIYQKFDKGITWRKQIKKTLIEIKNMKINKKNKTITGNMNHFINESPIWHEALNVWVLNFNGMVNTSSTKNTIIKDLRNNRVALFGKMRENEYDLNIKYPFSLIQGITFAIACLNK
jgi:hypothetical protein